MTVAWTLNEHERENCIVGFWDGEFEMAKILYHRFV